MTLRRPLVLIALAIAALPAMAVTKCVDRAGKVTYQEGACPDDAKQDALKTPIPAAKAAAPATPADPDVILQLASDQATLDSCEQVAPGFLAQYRDDVAAWRAFHSAALARYEPMPQYREILENGRTQLNDQILRVPGGAEKLARFCHAQYIPAFRRTIGKV